jgi:hypothetical protein
MIKKTIKHSTSGSALISTEIKWTMFGITIVRKTHYYPKLKECEYTMGF